MRRICNAVRLDRALSDLKSADVHGVVIGVYRKCFNVLIGSGTIVSVFVNTGYAMPMSIHTNLNEGGEPFFDCVFEGDDVWISGGVLTSDGFACILFDAILQEMHRCAVPGTDAAILENQQLLFASLLKKHGKRRGQGKNLERWIKFLFEGIAPPPSEKILCSLAYLFEAIRSGEKQAVIAGLERTVGAGIGLTPSADDVICGMCHALYLFGAGGEFLSLLRSYVKAFGRGRTTLVSTQQLELSADGAMSDPLFHLMQCIAQNVPEDTMRRALCKTVEYGSSSGTELCMGILAGCCLVSTEAAGQTMCFAAGKESGNYDGQKEFCGEKQIL